MSPFASFAARNRLLLSSSSSLAASSWRKTRSREIARNVSTAVIARKYVRKRPIDPPPLLKHGAISLAELNVQMII
jgi:hypothetical protein